LRWRQSKYLDEIGEEGLPINPLQIFPKDVPSGFITNMSPFPVRELKKDNRKSGIQISLQ